MENEIEFDEDAYAEWLMANPDGEWPICNGDMLLEQMEAGHRLEEYLESLND